MARPKNIYVAQADRYYDQDDYYTKDAAAPSQWHGKGASALGLSGAVKPEDFKALARGQLPDGTSLHRGGGKDRRAGTDFEFSAPKSFSIQALVMGDDRLVQVHEQAVTEARQRIEAVIATRVTQNGRTSVEQTGNAVIAQFLHTTNRAGDPNLHSHVVALNLTQRADGQWRSVDNEGMFRDQRLMYEIYLSELAKGARALGYRIATGKHGNPELAHITRDQIEHFSSRSMDIEAALAERGLTRATATAEQKKAVTLATRNAKQKYDRDALTREWQTRARGVGLDPSASKPGEGKEAQPDKAEKAAERNGAREAVEFALAHLSEREAAFSRNEVLTVALRESRGATGIKAIETELARFQRQGEVRSSRNGQRLTTLKALDIERRILAIEERGRGKVAPVAPAAVAARHLAGQTLTVGQAQAVQLAATSENRVNGIQGVAGSGKTTALRSLKGLAGQNDYQMLGLAPSHSAVKALTEAGIETRTLQSWLSDREAGAALTDRTVLVLDEAGLVGNRNLLSTLERARRGGARVLLVGDTRQYQAVEAGRAFAQLQQKGMATAQMKEILRQRDGKLLEAARLSVDEPARALAHLEVREIADADARYDRIAQDYAAASPEVRQSTLILTGTNEARTGLNQAVRATLKAQGELSGPRVVLRTFQRKDATEAEQKRLDRYAVGDALLFQKDYPSLGVARGEIYRVAAIGDDHLVATGDADKRISLAPARLSGKGLTLGRIEDREIAVGEALRVTGTDRALGIRNGERGIVESVSGDALVMQLPDGSRRTFGADRTLPVEYGYAATGHSAQGLGADRVLLDKDTKAKTTDHRSFYTDLTRARYAAVVYTNDRGALPRAIVRQSEKTAALDVVREAARTGPTRPSAPTSRVRAAQDSTIGISR